MRPCHDYSVRLATFDATSHTSQLCGLQNDVILPSPSTFPSLDAYFSVDRSLADIDKNN